MNSSHRNRRLAQELGNNDRHPHDDDQHKDRVVVVGGFNSNGGGGHGNDDNRSRSGHLRHARNGHHQRQPPSLDHSSLGTEEYDDEVEDVSHELSQSSGSGNQVPGSSNSDSYEFSSNNSGSNGNSSNRRRSAHPLLGRKETRQIGWVRTIVFSALLLATVTISVVIYVSVRSSEQDEFENQMRNHGNTILDATTLHFHSTLQALDQLALTLTGESESKGAQWPNVTMSEFVERSASIIDWGQLEGLVVLPKVTAADRAGYEAYVQEHVDEWLPEAMQFYSVVDPVTNEPAKDGDTFKTAPRIYSAFDGTSVVEESDANAPFFPAWQVAPPIPGVVNLNFRANVAGINSDGDDADIPRDVEVIDLASQDQTAIMSSFLSIPSLERNNADLTTNVAIPKSPLFFPLIEDGKTVGLAWGTISWDLYLQPTNLASSAVGMQIVLSTPCGNGHGGVSEPVTAKDEKPIFHTFQIDSDGRVVYEGAGDLHDSKYNYLRSSLDMFSTTKNVLDVDDDKSSTRLQDHRTNQLKLFSGVPFNDSYCPYTIEVYPTKSMQQDFLTVKPAVYTILVVVVFIITSLVFVGYDSLVERRQRKVLKTATKSHQIVSSLFPKNVRDRLFRDDDDDNNNGGRRRRGQNENHHQHDDNDMMIGNDHGAVMGPFVSQKTKLKGFLSKQQQKSETTTTTNITNDQIALATTLTKSKPIADLFPHTTVLFADVSGFTAWSSTREPSQVFILLETLYGTFDQLAERRRVFKVETIGDCYVAVTGLPDPQLDHAVIMAKFAGEMLVRMTNVTNQLEVELGPDTSDLRLRIGLHSGPVTAGVLRGQKSRFQLFGDTVNMASRMESHGRPNRIMCSQETADLLIEAGKRGWVHPRQDAINAKGKGVVQAYWVHPRGVGMPHHHGHSNTTSSVITGSSGYSARYAHDETSNASSNGEDDHAQFDGPQRTPSGNDMLGPSKSGHSTFNGAAGDQRGNNGSNNNSTMANPSHALSPNMKRLVDWNVDLLSRLLRSIVAKRLSLKQSKANLLNKVNPVNLASSTIQFANNNIINPIANAAAIAGLPTDSLVEDIDNPRNLYAEAIHLPQFEKASIQLVHPDDIVLKKNVQEQLCDYVTKIARSYHDNPFHNFDHASHVTMSANKILARVVAAEDVDMEAYQQQAKRKKNEIHAAAKRHNFSYGITSDPLTHFACVFSAMIHDADHPGVPNGQLVAEGSEMATLYGNKSVAEQNSVDLAWGLLLDPAYEALRKCMFADQEDDKRRFRQLLVNSVMATDIFDPELKEMRNKRWEKAFSSNISSNGTVTSTSKESSDLTDLKATIVIEHIIQAADVSHTMQHWHVYQKWNKRLFYEMYSSYQDGRLDSDPSIGWYKGELWFYDNYIIPLARKLAECGVFGVSSDEFLTYAQANRTEWESKGESIVIALKEDYEATMKQH